MKNQNEVRVNGTLYIPATNEKYNIHDVKVVVGGVNYVTTGTVTSILRKVLKANGIKPSQFRFKSNEFSGGTSIDVSEKENPDEGLRPFMKKIVANFQGGSFDGMTDMYTYGKEPFFVSEDGTINVGVSYKFSFFNTYR